MNTGGNKRLILTTNARMLLITRFRIQVAVIKDILLDWMWIYSDGVYSKMHIGKIKEQIQLEGGREGGREGKVERGKNECHKWF